MSLSSLHVVSRVALPSLAVLDELPELRVLHLDRVWADPAPIGRLAMLEELMLGHANALPSLPASLRTLHLIDCDGLRASEALAPLRQLEVLRLTDCGALRTLDVSALSTLRELAISGASSLESIELGAPTQLAELRLDRRQVFIRDPFALGLEDVAIHDLGRVPVAQPTFELPVQAVPARRHVRDDPVRERRPLVVVRV
jgi:hypothetical protein